jgi:hypothetical protein
MTVLVRVGTVASSRKVFAFELVKPSSVVVTGSGSESATVSALGSVEFSSCTTVSLNGVFSSGYDNYTIVCWFKGVTTAAYTGLRLRAGGSDNSTSNYTRQYLTANGTTIAGLRNTSATLVSGFGYSAGSSAPAGWAFYLYGPYLAQPTAGRELEARTFANATVNDDAFTFSGSDQFDGFSLIEEYTASNLVGRVAVYGMRG